LAVFHYYALRAFAHATEDPERVRAAVRALAGPASGDLAFGETAVEGSHGNRILILEAQVRSAQAERALFASLARDDPAGASRLAAEVEQRLDEHLNFFARFDKQEAFRGRVALASSDDAVTFRGKVRSFPKTGEDAGLQALQALRGLLGGAQARNGIER
jgi:RNA binding exosome subunit